MFHRYIKLSQAQDRTNEVREAAAAAVIVAADAASAATTAATAHVKELHLAEARQQLVGIDGQCSPGHTTHVEPSCLVINDIL